MKKQLIITIMFLLITSCSEMLKEPRIERDDIIKIYNELKKDSVFTKFIGYYIVRRDDSEYFFMYRNLMIDSSDFVVPNLKATEGTQDYKEKELFFKQNPDAKLQFDIMKKLGIKAVFTDNYNTKTKRLESNDSVGYDFNKYKLTFAITDSIDIANINFDLNEYLQITNYTVEEKLDSNWLVLKR